MKYYIRDINLTKNKFIIGLFNVLILFVVFDGVRDQLKFGSYISQLKEGLVFLIFCITLHFNNYRFRLRIYNLPIKLFYLYHIILGIFSIAAGIFYNKWSIIFYYKYFQFFMLIYVFYYYEELTQKTYISLFKQLVLLSCFFVIFNIIFYFKYIPIFIQPRPWFGRISQGYPTMDIITLSYSVVLFLFLHSNFNFNKIKNLIIISILFLGMVMQMTGTGFVIIGMLAGGMIFSHFNYVKIKFSSSQKLFWKTVVLGAFFLVMAIMYVKVNYPGLYKGMYGLGQVKINILLGNTEKGQPNTLEYREFQFQKAYDRYCNTDLKRFFGIGYDKISLVNRTQATIYIENQYGINKVAMGFLGNGIFYLFLVSLIYEAFLVKKYDLQLFWIMIFCTGIFIVNCKTLAPFYLFSNMTYFALIYAWFKKKKDSYRC